MYRFEFPYGLSVPLADADAVTLFLVTTGARVAAPTLQSAVQASRVFTDAGVAADETITIVRVDGSSVVYIWKAALTPTKNEVLLGASNTTALANMVSAITGAGTPGTDYATGTEPCRDWGATSDGTTITITAINYGDAYNTAIGNFAETCASGSWAAATSGVDTPDFKEALNYGTQANASAAPIVRNGVIVMVVPSE